MTELTRAWRSFPELSIWGSKNQIYKCGSLDVITAPCGLSEERVFRFKNHKLPLNLLPPQRPSHPRSPDLPSQPTACAAGHLEFCRVPPRPCVT